MSKGQSSKIVGNENMNFTCIISYIYIDILEMVMIRIKCKKVEDEK